jgi:RNA polymerase sigma factor (sigma-70 family)
MPLDDPGSVTHWIGDLKDGGDAAAQLIWERYFEKLVHLARNRMRGRKLTPVEDEEDAAISAFDSFCRRASLGKFPRLNDRDDLWRLLVVLTVRKVIDQLERERAVMRGPDKVVSEAVLKSPDGRGGLDALAGREPSPEFAAMVAEQYTELRSTLGDDTLRKILDLRLEGYTREEIAARLNVAERTVTRKLDLIRHSWLGEQV